MFIFIFSFDVIGPNEKNNPFKSPFIKTIKPTKIPLLTFPLKMYYEVKNKISSRPVQLTAYFFE